MATAVTPRDRHTQAPVGPLAGSVAVVTGGGRGIGRVLACQLATAGAAVGVVARSACELERTVQLIGDAGGTAAAATADVSAPDAVRAAFDRLRRQLGPVDLLVNNAGVCGPIGPAWEVDPDDWWTTCEINLRSVFLCTRLALPDMIARRHGRIVNLTSSAGTHRWPDVSAYAVSKAAVIKLTENLAAETRPHGVSLFSVHPGLVPIGLTDAAFADAAQTPSQARVFSWLRGELAAGRGAQPEWAAQLLVQLASGRADSLSGCHLSVHDDLDTLLTRSDEIRRDNLCMLGRRKLPRRSPEEIRADAKPTRRRRPTRPSRSMGTRIQSRWGAKRAHRRRSCRFAGRIVRCRATRMTPKN